MPQDHEVIFRPSGISITIAEDTTLLQAVRLAGLTVEAPCDGRGSCGKCLVRVSGALSRPDETEVSKLGDLLTAGIRLACRAKIRGAVQAELLDNRRQTFVALTEGQSKQLVIEPSVYRITVDPEADKEVRGLWDVEMAPFFPDNYPVLLQERADDYKNGLARRELIVKDARLLDWRYQSGQPYHGIAVDIGTTSVVVELFDLGTGRSLGVRSCLNPQTEFGGDVLTRISFAGRQADGTQILQRKIMEGLNRLIDQLVDEAHIRHEDIYQAVIAGNTTMQHLFMGVNPYSLAQAPYRPVFTRQLEVAPAAVGLGISPRGIVTVLPSAAAFVGADIVAGLLVAGLHKCAQTSLFIDIGTNGEIVICRNGLLIGTSSAAGPALEGMNITCGCRAEDGAIEGVAIAGDGRLNIKTIGNSTARGICGSGLIDLVAELVKWGVITASGRFANREKMAAALATRLMDVDGKPAFLVSEAGPVVLSQKDVRQIQLAKGAIAAAIDLLLKELAIRYEDLDEILVAGAFGFHLKPASLVEIGLLPPACRDKIRFLGNTAKEGAKAVLLNRQASLEILAIEQNLKVMELSLQAEFQDYFVKALAFPNA